MAFSVQALRDEITNDPKALGYAPFKAASNYQGLLNLVNGTYPGVTVVWRNDLKSWEVLASLIESEVSTLTQLQWTRVQTLLIPPMIDVSNQLIRDQFAGIFAGKTGTIINLVTVGQKAATTRAEELWGYRFEVTEQNVIDAISG